MACLSLLCHWPNHFPFITHVLHGFFSPARFFFLEAAPHKPASSFLFCISMVPLHSKVQSLHQRPISCFSAAHERWLSKQSMQSAYVPGRPPNRPYRPTSYRFSKASYLVFDWKTVHSFPMRAVFFHILSAQAWPSMHQVPMQDHVPASLHAHQPCTCVTIKTLLNCLLAATTSLHLRFATSHAISSSFIASLHLQRHMRQVANSHVASPILGYK